MLRFNNDQHSGGQRLPLITSRNNPIVKAIRGLASRKERERSGQCFIEGLHLVAAAAQQNSIIDICVVAPDLLTSGFGRDLARDIVARGARQIDVSAEVFHSLAAKDRAQGLGVVVRQHWARLAEFDVSAGRCWVALDAVQYPGNLGAILRTCDAVGADGLILLGDTADPYDPAAVRASVGAIFAQPLARARFAEFIEWKRQNQVMAVGTSPLAEQDYRSVAYQPPVVLLMGSEPRGLARDQQDWCDTVVTIPMVGQADSLNLAVAASVLLYEIFHQQRQ